MRNGMKALVKIVTRVEENVYLWDQFLLSVVSKIIIGVSKNVKTP